MIEKYLDFMVFELDDSGERIQMDITEEEFRENNGTNLLHPEQVAVIVKEGIRRIFIWKGAKSPVRKRFISSRVANKLQEELVKEAAFHRCKIVSVDQGDEPVEFLNAFAFESMEVKERMADMRYVRNVEKDTTRAKGKVVKGSKSKLKEKEEEYYSPALEELKREGRDIRQKPAASEPSFPPSRPQSKPYSRPKPKLRPLNTTDIIDSILENDPPNNYKRQNLIIQKQLFGATSKVTNVFGEDVEDIEWEKVLQLPEGVHILKNYIFRIYCDKQQGIVKGVEILKSEKNSGKNSKIGKTHINLSASKEGVEEKILEVEPPKDHYRQNLIIGKELYGYISKKVEVFGEEQEEEEWTLIKKIPKEIISLKNHLFRIYFNSERKQIDAIEILQKGSREGKIAITKQDVDSVNGEKAKKEDEASNSKHRDLPPVPSSN